MAGIKIVNLPALGRNLASTDLFELSLAGGTGSRKITGQEIINGIPLPPSGLNIGTTAITSGTVGRVLFEGTGNVVQESANLFWDNTNGRLGIGGVTPFHNLVIYNASSPNFALRNTSRVWQHYLLSSSYRIGTDAADMINIAGATGNVGIGTTTDAGFKLDVNGTARVQSFIMVNRTSNSNDAVAVFNPTGTLSASNLQYQIGLFGGLSNLYIAYNNGSTTQTIFRYIQSTNVSEYLTSLTTTGYIAANASAYFASNGGSEVVIGTSGSVNSALLNVQSTTRGFLPPRMTTTQKNAIATPATGLEVFDSTTLTPSVFNGTNWQNLLVPNSNGNVLIGTTTDAGFKLDVNGTARVSETITSSLSSANWDSGTYNILDLQRNGSSRATLKSNGTFSWTSGTDLTINSASGSARTVLSSVSAEILAVANQASIDYNARFSQRAGKIAVRVLGITGTTQNLFEVLTGASANVFQIKSDGRINMSAIPTSPVGLNAGDLYNNLGVLMIV